MWKSSQNRLFGGFWDQKIRKSEFLPNFLTVLHNLEVFSCAGFKACPKSTPFRDGIPLMARLFGQAVTLSIWIQIFIPTKAWLKTKGARRAGYFSPRLFSAIKTWHGITIKDENLILQPPLGAHPDLDILFERRRWDTTTSVNQKRAFRLFMASLKSKNCHQS